MLSVYRFESKLLCRRLRCYQMHLPSLFYEFIGKPSIFIAGVQFMLSVYRFESELLCRGFAAIKCICPLYSTNSLVARFLRWRYSFMRKICPLDDRKGVGCASRSTTPRQTMSGSIYSGRYYNQSPVGFPTADELLAEPVDSSKSGESISVMTRFRPMRFKFQSLYLVVAVNMNIREVMRFLGTPIEMFKMSSILQLLMPFVILCHPLRFFIIDCPLLTSLPSLSRKFCYPASPSHYR